MFWNEERDSLLRDMWPKTFMTLDQVGRELGCCAAYCSQRAAAIGLPKRTRFAGMRYARAVREFHGDIVRTQPHFTFVGPDAEYVANAAKKRNVLVQTLMHNLMRAVVRDKMIDAVLDDQNPVDQMKEAAKC